VPPDLRAFCRVGSIADPLPGRYDLIVCIEVLEHMTPEAGRRGIAHLCQAASDILFSSTPFDYKEATHFNVQPPEGWAELFAQCGFVRDVDYDASFITPWAARFRRSDQPLARTVRDYERRFWLLWKENTDLRALVGEMRDQLSQAELHAVPRAGVGAGDDLVRLRERLLASEAAQTVEASKARQAELLLADLQSGVGWRMLRGLREMRLRLAPPGSRRDRVFKSLLRRMRP
jgi:hypothetical protein